MRKSALVLKPSNGWYSIYDIPPDQRATFHVWLRNNRRNGETLDRKILVSDNQKSDELGLVTGYLYNDYLKWYNTWNGHILMPAIKGKSRESPLTLQMCDEIIANNEILPTDEVYTIRDQLLEFMVYPFQHNTVQLNTEGFIYTIYELKKGLDKIFSNALINPPMVQLYIRKRNIYLELQKGIIASYYGYSTTSI